MPGIITSTFTPTLVGGPERDGLGTVSDTWPDLRIFVEGPTEVLESDHSYAIVPFKVPWALRQLLATQLLGGPYNDAVPPAISFKRHLPETYRLWTWDLASVYNPTLVNAKVPVMRCTKILKIMGIGDGVQDAGRTGDDYYPAPTYKWARVEALFETMAFDVKLLSAITEVPGLPRELQRYVIRREQGGGKYLTFNWGQWILKDGANTTAPLARQVSFFEPYKTLTYEWFDVLDGMCNHVSNQLLLGSTNLAQFDGKYAPETLLLLRADREPRMDPFGSRMYRHFFEMGYFPSGVNKARPPGIPPVGTAEYWSIVDKTDQTTKPYKGKDYDQLFKP